MVIYLVVSHVHDGPLRLPADLMHECIRSSTQNTTSTLYVVCHMANGIASYPGNAESYRCYGFSALKRPKLPFDDTSFPRR